MYPLVKIEYIYEDDGDNRPQIITKEIPFAATELAKLRKDFERTARESETEYVWRVLLSEGMASCCVRKGSRRVLGPGSVLNHRRSPSPVVADSEGRILGGGVEPAGEGGSPGHNGHNRSRSALESVQKAACLQMMYDWEHKPSLSSPMLLLADPERKTPLI